VRGHIASAVGLAPRRIVVDDHRALLLDLLLRREKMYPGETADRFCLIVTDGGCRSGREGNE
jgi:hypothetical protein